jgi:hypothetical protein
MVPEVLHISRYTPICGIIPAALKQPDLPQPRPRASTRRPAALLSKPSQGEAAWRRVRAPSLWLPRALRALAHEAVVPENGPHPTDRREPTARPGTPCHPRRPCHERAIHSRPERSRTDNHGQRQYGLDLRRCLPSQVTTLRDLALRAGGGRFKSGRPDHRRIAMAACAFASRPAGPALAADRVGRDALSHAHSERREQLDRFTGA